MVWMVKLLCHLRRWNRAKNQRWPRLFIILIFKSLPHHNKANITETNIKQMVHVAYEIKGNWISNKTIYFLNFILIFDLLSVNNQICKFMQSGQNMEKYQLQTIADQTNIVQIYCNYTVIITYIVVTYIYIFMINNQIVFKISKFWFVC